LPKDVFAPLQGQAQIARHVIDTHFVPTHVVGMRQDSTGLTGEQTLV
jgi:hypothetical protein